MCIIGSKTVLITSLTNLDAAWCLLRQRLEEINLLFGDRVVEALHLGQANELETIDDVEEN